MREEGWERERGKRKGGRGAWEGKKLGMDQWDGSERRCGQEEWGEWEGSVGRECEEEDMGGKMREGCCRREYKDIEEAWDKYIHMQRSD